MLKAYLDASGSDGQSPFVVVCGYVADEQNWHGFNEEFLNMLDRERVEVPLHMTDLMSLYKAFSRKDGWDENRRDQLLQRAFKIIRERTDYGGAGVINIADCETFFPRRRKYSKEYAIATLSCIVGIAKLAKRSGRAELIEYVFESGDAGYPEVSNALRVAFEDPRQREHYLISGWCVKDKADAPELQAADILAHQTRRAFIQAGGLHNLDFERRVTPGLIRSQDKWIYFYDKENLPIMKSLGDYLERHVTSLS